MQQEQVAYQHWFTLEALDPPEALHGLQHASTQPEAESRLLVCSCHMHALENLKLPGSC